MPIPIAGLIMSGLSLLPKIPALWKGVAEIFGKEVPESVEKAGALMGEVSGLLAKGQATPEQQLQLKALMYQNEKEIRDHELKEKEMDYDYEKTMSAQFVELWTKDTTAQNKYVAETRPKLLRQLFWACILYDIVTLIVIGLLTWGEIKPDNIKLFLEVVLYQAGFLHGTFATAYLGYTGARSLDKRSPQLKEQNNTVGKILKGVLG